MLKRRIVQYWTTIKDTCKKHRKTAIAILLMIAVAAGGSVGYKLMTSTDSGVASDEQKLEQAKEAEEEAISEEKKAEAELEKAKESGDKEAIEAAKKKVAEAKEKVDSAKKKVSSSSSSNSSASKPSSSKPSNSSSSGSSSASKPSKPSGGSSSGSSGSSSSGASGGSSTSKPSKPAHSHSWTPVYGERQVQVVEYRKEYVGDVKICNVCGAENPSVEHAKNHVKAGEGYSSHVEPVYKDVPYTVTKTEQYIKYYKCSCGATK